MKKSTKIFLLTFLMMLAFSISVSAQCEAKTISLASGTATITGKTGGCNQFKFSITEGHRVRISLTSNDGKSRFNLQWNAEEDETGTELFENQTNFNQILEYPNWLIDIRGTNGATYSLKITVTNQ